MIEGLYSRKDSIVSAKFGTFSILYVCLVFKKTEIDPSVINVKSVNAQSEK